MGEVKYDKVIMRGRHVDMGPYIVLTSPWEIKTIRYKEFSLRGS